MQPPVKISVGPSSENGPAPSSPSGMMMSRWWSFGLGVVLTLACVHGPSHFASIANSPPTTTATATSSSRAASFRSAAAKAASNAGGAIPTLGRDVAAYLTTVNEHVVSNVTVTLWPSEPNPVPPVEVPFIARLVAAASALNSNPQTAAARTEAAAKMLMIKTRLGRAGDVGNTPPPAPTAQMPVLNNFPDAHHFHQECGKEWYYVASKLPIQEMSGQRRKGEVSILVSIERTRAVSVDYWRSNLQGQVPGWESDSVNQLGFVVATVSARFFSNTYPYAVERSIYATNNHSAHWAAVDPEGISFSVPGQPFAIRVGNVSLTSLAPATSTDILPLQLVAAGDHFAFNFTIDKKKEITAGNNGFFLQGNPQQFAIGSLGTGFTADPSPGIYYSWPQLQITVPAGAFALDGAMVNVTGPGNGWIDHQLLGTTLTNPLDAATGKPSVEPIPFRQDASPVNGWLWQFCNLDNGTAAWTGASFVIGNPELSPLGINPYGYYIELVNGAWKAHFTAGATIAIPTVPAIAPAGSAMGDPFVTAVPVPNGRVYWELKLEITTSGFWAWIEFLKDFVLSSKGYYSAQANGWTTAAIDPATKQPTPFVGNFNNGDFSMSAEAPATFTTYVGENFGWGYLETVGFEPTATEEIRMLHYIETTIPTTLNHVERTGV